MGNRDKRDDKSKKPKKTVKQPSASYVPPAAPVEVVRKKRKVGLPDES